MKALIIMTFEQYEIWLANLNPQIGTEPGKIRPVLVIQTDMLNKIPHMIGIDMSCYNQCCTKCKISACTFDGRNSFFAQ